MPPVTKAIKWLMIITVGVWLVFQVIGHKFFGFQVIPYLGLYPGDVILNFKIWQVVTYIFLHSEDSVMHIVFNMLSLWMIGAELEQRWGPKFFVFYYLACGIGAALIYCLGVALFTVISGNQAGLAIPVVGASGAIFGLFLAFGLLFGERTMHFWFLFPMKAKVFVLILAGIELVSLVSSGASGGEVANLAHLGGFISGYLTLLGYTKWQRMQQNQKAKKKGRNLRLVVDNENSDPKPGDGPKYWN